MEKKTTEKLLIEWVKSIWNQGDSYFANYTSKGKWEVGYRNDYPMQHGYGKKVVLPSEMVESILSLLSHPLKDAGVPSDDLIIHLLEWVGLNYECVKSDNGQVAWNLDDDEALYPTEDVVQDYFEHNPPAPGHTAVSKEEKGIPSDVMLVSFNDGDRLRYCEAKYVKHLTVEAPGDYDGEVDEKDDMFYIPEGWYMAYEHTETGRINHKIISQHPLPLNQSPVSKAEEAIEIKKAIRERMQNRDVTRKHIATQAPNLNTGVFDALDEEDEWFLSLLPSVPQSETNTKA